MKKAFTIVELLVVIVVIGILAAITIISYTGISNKAVVSSLQSDLSSAKKQLALYQIEHSTFPASPLTINGNNFCPSDDSKYCFKLSSNNSFIGYSASNSSSLQSFLLIAGNGNTNYKVTNATSPTQLAQTMQPNVTPGAVLELRAAKANGGITPGINSPFTTTWTDTSGNNNNGTLTNFDGTVASGWATGSARLVSPGASRNVTTPVIAYGDSFTFEIIGSHSDLGVTSSNTGCFLGTGSDANGRWYFGRAWDRIMLQAYDESTGSNLHGYGVYGYSITDWPANIVAHVHVVKTIATTKYYLNGSLFNTANNNVVNPMLTTLPTYVMGGRGYMAGSVSIARIYPFALTAAQVSANYAAGAN